MKNLVQALIDEHPDIWLGVLQGYHIKNTFDGDLVSLSYDQLASPMELPIVQQCRGMVVDRKRGTVLAWPYHKFWNYGEKLADDIDWATARVQEKLDGSLMILYYDPNGGPAGEGDWRVASSGTPTAGGSFGKGNEKQTFAEAFWSLFSSLGYRLPENSCRTTFMFELCADENRIVVKHEQPRLVLHGARNEHGSEAKRASLETYGDMFGWEVVREFPIRSLAECLAAADALDPLAQEGFVVVDHLCRRVKIKSPRYVILHHMKGEATPRRAIELWQTGEASELLAHFPEMRSTIDPVHHMLEIAVSNAYIDVLRLSAPAIIYTDAPRAEDGVTRVYPDRKAYAYAIKNRPWAAACFALYGEVRVTRDMVAAVMRRQTLASLERMLDRMSAEGETAEVEALGRLALGGVA